MNTQARQERLVRSLRRNGSTTVKQLAEELGASRRTILRDLVALRDLGYIIHSESGPGGGVEIDLRSVQTSPRLTVGEVFALLLSVASMRAAGNLPFAGLADSGLAKLEKALPSDKIRDLQQMLDCLYVGELASEIDTSKVGQMAEGLLEEFERAFLDRLPLSFCYSDTKGVLTSRSVEPQAVLILPPIWYLVAWDPSRNDFRHFRMDRIRNPKCENGPIFRKRQVSFAGKISRIRGN